MAGIYADSSMICSVYVFALIKYRSSDLANMIKKFHVKMFEGFF